MQDGATQGGSSAAAVSALASRLWITTGSPTSSASASWASNRVRCSRRAAGAVGRPSSPISPTATTRG